MNRVTILDVFEFFWTFLVFTNLSKSMKILGMKQNVLIVTIKMRILSCSDRELEAPKSIEN